MVSMHQISDVYIYIYIAIKVLKRLIVSKSVQIKKNLVGEL
jgi:hypothetical protein